MRVHSLALAVLVLVPWTTLPATAQPEPIRRIWLSYSDSACTRLTISWTTDRPLSSTVHFGPAPSLGQSVPVHGQRTRHQVEKALRGYKDINMLAMQLLSPGGILTTFSCSAGVDAEAFTLAVSWAGIDAGRETGETRRKSLIRELEN